MNFPAVMHLFKVSNWNTRTMCEIYSKVPINTLERRQWRRFGAIIVNFEQISHIVLVFQIFQKTNISYPLIRTRACFPVTPFEIRPFNLLPTSCGSILITKAWKNFIFFLTITLSKFIIVYITTRHSSYS